jgi:23S rRNA pseudouridine1911/1915/1917 synthase
MSRLRGHVVPRPAEVAEGSVVSVFRVPLEQEGMRLDHFLHDQLRRTSRTRVQDIIWRSAFDEAGRRLKPNARVRPSDLVVLWRPPWDEQDVPTDIPIAYEDEHLLAVSKPALLPVHPTARYHNNTLIKKLQAARPGAWLSLGHRLDRETSGLLLVSKTPECDRKLKRQFEERDDIEKVYIALTWGIYPGASATQFRCERAMRLDPTSSLSVKMAVSDAPDALTAATVFELQGARYGDNGQQYGRVRCTLESGRQHQIRLHLASLGSPVVGDKLYGPDERMFARGADNELTDADRVLLELPRHALHAAELRMRHPMTGAALEVLAPLPADLEEFWEGLAATAARADMNLSR